ncbi:MAG: PEP-CTERM-box response regulator transcription factor [Desulfuromonadaceae bacterium]
MENLLIIDDNADMRQQLKWGLGDDYHILLAGDVNEGLILFKKYMPRVVILDLGLPPHEDTSFEGFRGLGELLKLNPFVKVIMLTGNSERENALKATQMGAYDFFPKPPVLSEFKVVIRRAFNLANLEEQNRTLQRELEQQSKDFGGMLGHCPEMQTLFSTIKKVAPSDISIFISGENGTGKELVARAIHDAGTRKSGPFIAINCGAIPENLLESELFGHEKGAFTGAHAMVQGKLQYANKGTLFLDEIGELPVNLQVKLLRFLQEGVIQRVGGRLDIPVDARVVCATNVDIAQAIKQGRFREDLYYRVSVISIHLPPLRERGDDTLLLAHYYLSLFNKEYHKNIRRFSGTAVDFLTSYNWPGNVRELRNRVQRAVVMSETTVLEPADLGCDAEKIPEEREEIEPVVNFNLKEARDKIEQRLINAAIDQQNGNIGKAAETLGISRPTLYDLMKKHGLSPTT